MIVTIYAHMAEDVRKRLERLEAKAKRYGVPFSYSFSVPHVISYKEAIIDKSAHCVRRSVEAHYAEVIDVTISEEAIRSNGWEVVAKIDHNENGEVGQRVTIHAEKIEVVANWFTNYSYYGESVYLYKITAKESGVFMWKTSTYIEEEERNKPHTIKATVKAHNDYNGVKQTVLTRCKIVS